jgi:hypothetical protein
MTRHNSCQITYLTKRTTKQNKTKQFNYTEINMKSDSIQSLLKSWKINDLLTVPCPRNDFSKDLPTGWCHHNVCNLQSKNGGSTVLGFTLNDLHDHIWCVPHSVWKHDDHGYIDVTFNNNQNIFFIPVVTYDATQAHWFLPHEYRIFKDKSKGVEWTMNSNSIKYLTSQELEDTDSTSLVFQRKYLLSDTDSWDDYLDELGDDNEYDDYDF